MPKPTRSNGGGQLRSHSRSSSSTRLGANLQFTATAKDAQAVRQPSGGKKGDASVQTQTNGYVYDAHHGAKAPFVRANSSQRVQSREQLARRLAPLQQPPPAQRQQQQQYAKANGKGFSIQAQAVDAGEDDEDEWESENGAATPNQEDSGSDTASESGPDQGSLDDQVAPSPQQYLQQPPSQQQQLPQGQMTAMTAQQQQQRKEAEERQQVYQRQRQLEALRYQQQLQQQQKVDQERYLEQQQQQQKLQQEQYQQELRLQQQRQIQAHQQQQQQQQQQPQQYQQRQQQQQQHLQQQQRQQLLLQQQQQQQQQQLYQQQHPPHIQTGFPVEEPDLIRVNTARPSDFEYASRSERHTPRTTTPSKQQQQQQQVPPQPHPPQRQQAPPQPQSPVDQPSMNRRPHTPRSDSEPIQQTASSTSDTSEAARYSPRPKRLSRPPSTHSIRSDHGLRPHPLFRGLTHGHTNSVPRPAPLAPLTVHPASAALPAISTSPPTSIIESANGRHYLSSSPTTSVRTTPGSPAVSEPPYSAFGHGRRLSISSAGTVPPQSAGGREAPWTHDRTRTLSTMSTASSSAALSSLANLPSVTRPPSPQTIAFFPPVNPHANVEAIHPLLPGPYLHNHLTVLSRRTPIRESFDRVMRAKNAR